MTLTIEITPELERQLRDEAARRGIDENALIVETLRERLAQPAVPSLPAAEAQLLEQINEGLPSDVWERHRALHAKRRAETLTVEEQLELVRLSDTIEEAGARRVAALAELARLRGVPLPDLMQQLGIPAASHA